MNAPARFTIHFADRSPISESADVHGGDYRRFISSHRRELAGALLSGQDLRGADLAGADLAGADLRGAALEDACLDGACLDRTNFAGANLYDASFRGAEGVRTVFNGALMFGSDWSGARLLTPRFDGTVFEPALGDPIRDKKRPARSDLWDEAMVIGGTYKGVGGDAVPKPVSRDKFRTAAITNVVFAGVTAATALALPHVLEAESIMHMMHENWMLMGTVGVAALYAKTKAEDWLKDILVERGGGAINDLRIRLNDALGERWLRNPAIKGLVAIVDSTKDFEPLQRAVVGIERKAAMSADRKKLISTLRADKGRLFVCDEKHLDEAIGELMAREKGHGTGVSTVVRTDLLGGADPDVPAVVRFDKSGATATWFRNGEPTHTAYFNNSGQLGNVWDFSAQEYITRDDPMFDKVPRLGEILESFRRHLENIKPRALQTTRHARERMGMAERSPTHAVLIDEKNKVFVCRRRLPDGGYGQIENPDPDKPAMIAFDGREFFYEAGRQVRSRGTIPDLQGAETPTFAGIACR
jgi:hypothetical protein